MKDESGRMTDTERLDWIEKQDGAALVSDDAGRWAVACDGVQNVPESDGAFDLDTHYWIKKEQFRGTVREAIDAAMERDELSQAGGDVTR